LAYFFRSAAEAAVPELVGGGQRAEQRALRSAGVAFDGVARRSLTSAHQS
jgi:hypothetical protein